MLSEMWLKNHWYRGVAQMGECVVWDHEVAGSSPVTPTTIDAGVAQW